MADVEVAVVGGGIAGLAAAVALRGAGREVLVLERAERLRPVGAGIALWPNALKALEVIGKGDEVRRRAVVPPAVGVRKTDGRWIFRDRSEDLRRRLGDVTAALPRADLLGMLADEIPDRQIRAGAEVVAVDERAEGVRLRLAGGSTVVAQAVVGADGVNSVIRDHVIGRRTPRPYRYGTFRALARYPSGVEAGAMDASETWGRGVRCGLLPVSAEEVYWFVTCAIDRVPEPEGPALGVGELVAGWHDPIPAVIGATEPAAVVFRPVFDVRPLIRWSEGTIVLVGDAAHAMAPDLGQGGCQALADAAALGQAMAANRSMSRAIDEYVRLRRRQANRVLRLSRAAGRSGQMRSWPACMLRDVSAGIVPDRVRQRRMASFAARNAG